MAGMKRRLGCCAGSAGVVLVGLYMVCMPVFAQNSARQGAKPPVKIAGDFDKVRILPPGGPAPRTADGHPDRLDVTIQTTLDGCFRLLTRSTKL